MIAVRQFNEADTRWYGPAILTCLLLSVLSTGCAISRPATPSPVPTVFTSTPSLQEVVEAINSHSARVQQLHADDVRLSMPGEFGSVQATLDFDRPNRFRLTGGTRMTGPELDLGSNDEIFWLWVKKNQPPTVFYGRHDQFFHGAARQFLPMPPNWMIEALGVIQVDPNGRHQLFDPGIPGLFEMHNRIPTPQGELLRILKIDQRTGAVVQQDMYGPDNTKLATATASDFRHDPLYNVTLPQRIQIALPPSGLAFVLEISEFTVNEQAADPMTLWSMPRLPNHQYRDVGNPTEMQGISLMGRPRQASSDTYQTSPTAQPIQTTASRFALPRLFPNRLLR